MRNCFTVMRRVSGQDVILPLHWRLAASGTRRWEHFAAGTALLWELDPVARTAFPGFTIPLADLFDDPNGIPTNHRSLPLLSTSPWPYSVRSGSGVQVVRSQFLTPYF